MGKPYKILATDAPVLDCIADVDTNNVELLQLMAELQLDPGSKRVITDAQKAKLLACIDGEKMHHSPGGSASNVLKTMKRMLSDAIDASMITLFEQGQNGKKLKDDFTRCGIHLITHMKTAGNVENGLSVVLRYCEGNAKGERAIATYGGNLKNMMDAEKLSADVITPMDAILHQSASARKLGFRFTDKLVNERWEQIREGKKPKELWYMIPANEQFSKQEHFFVKKMLATSNVVLGNLDELKVLLEPENQSKPNAKRLTTKLQSIFKKHGHILKDAGFKRPQEAFITDGTNGAWVITAKKIVHLPALKLKPDEVVNTLGAGDTSFAGYLSGHVLGLSPEKSGKLGVTLAAAKVKVNQATLEQPMEALKAQSSKLAEFIGNKITHMAVNHEVGR